MRQTLKHVIAHHRNNPTATSLVDLYLNINFLSITHSQHTVMYTQHLVGPADGSLRRAVLSSNAFSLPTTIVTAQQK